MTPDINSRARQLLVDIGLKESKGDPPEIVAQYDMLVAGMTISKERIERAAKAMFDEAVASADPQDSWRYTAWDEQNDLLHKSFRRQARAALESDAPEIASAELRGRVEGLTEARGYVVYSWSFGSVTSTIDARLIALQSTDARLASLQPEVAKREEGV